MCVPTKNLWIVFLVASSLASLAQPNPLPEYTIAAENSFSSYTTATEDSASLLSTSAEEDIPQAAFAEDSTSQAAVSRRRLKNDLNNDGKVDSKDTNILYWFLTRPRELVQDKHKPVIRVFAALPSTVPHSDETKLNWEVEGLPDSIVIDHGVGDVTTRSSIIVEPRQTTTYTLTASNSFGSTTAAILVTVVPKIVSFTASPASLSDEVETSTLSWSVSGEYSCIQINNGVGEVTDQTRVQVSSTGTYTLQVFYSSNAQRPCSGSFVSQQVSIGNLPIIESFTAEPEAIELGDGSVLSWTIRGETSRVSINKGIGDVSDLSSIEVFPNITTTYILTAENRHGRTTKTVQVELLANRPLIESFTAEPAAIESGDGSVLSWNIEGDTDQVSINNGIGDVSDISSIEVFPDRSTTYTLTAENRYGRISKTVRVEVLSLPVIESFTVNPALISPNSDLESVSLRWEISGGGSLQLNMQEVDSEGNKTDSRYCRNLRSTQTACTIYFLNSTTDFILTARNALGTAESSVVRANVLTLNPPPLALITEGQSSRLSWEGSGPAESLQLQKREGSGSYGSPVTVTGLTNYEVSPTAASTFYRLKAQYSGQSIYSNTRNVKVGKINSFSASPPFVVKFDNSAVSLSTQRSERITRLRWSLSNITASQISIIKTSGDQETDISQSCRFSGCGVIPDDTATTYTLKVNDSNISQQTTVNTLKIGRFKSTLGSTESTHQGCQLTNTQQRAVGNTSIAEALECLTVPGGQSINLSWAGFEGYDSLQLQTCQLDSASDSTCTNTMQTVTGNANSITVTPGEAFNIYTLSAQKQSGSYSKTIKLRIKVTVQNEVRINAFSADDRIIKQGSSDQTAILNYHISGKDPISFTLSKRPIGENLEQVFSNTSPSDNKRSSYTQSFADADDQSTTNFTLTADNAFGSVQNKSVKIYYLKMGDFTATAGSSTSQATGCSGADQCLTVTSGTSVTFNWDGVEGFGDERTSSCGTGNLPECITDTLEITYSRSSVEEISIADSMLSGSTTLSGSSNSNRIQRAPTSTAVYTLTAKKQVGSETESLSKTIRIIVQDAPAINSFTARTTTLNSSPLNRILQTATSSTYLHYAHTGKDPYNLKLEEKPQGASTFTTGGGFNVCTSNGGDSCKNYRQVSPTKTTEYKLTAERTSPQQTDTATLKIYTMGVGTFKAQVRRNSSNIESCNSISGDSRNCTTLSRSACSGADECLSVFPNEAVRFSWDGITGFEDERAGDLVMISKNSSLACSASTYQDNTNPSISGAVTFNSSNTTGICIYTLKVQKTLGSGDDAETEKVEKTIKISVQRSFGFDSFESKEGSGTNSAANRILQITTADGTDSTWLHWRAYAVTSSDTFKLKAQKEGESAGSFTTLTTVDFSSFECNNFSDSAGSNGVNCKVQISDIDKTTTYTVQATNSDSGTVTSSPLKVYVLKMGRFKGIRNNTGSESSACNLGAGQSGECLALQESNNESASLQWDLAGFGGEGTDTLQIETNTSAGHGLSCGSPCRVNVKNRNQLTVRTTTTTTYTLTATKRIGTETESFSKKVKVTLLPSPQVSSFKIIKRGSDPKAEVTRCQDGNCGNWDAEWSTTNASIVTLSISQTKDDGSKLEDCEGNTGEAACTDADDLSSAGASQSSQVTQLTTANRTTKYCLRAKNALGFSENCKTVRVFRVIDFTASRACVPSGGSSNLSWKVAEGKSGSQSVEITNSLDSNNLDGRSTCTLDSNRIETVCTGIYNLSGLTSTVTYTLIAKKPLSSLSDITHSDTQAVQVGSCPSSSIPPKVSQTPASWSQKYISSADSNIYKQASQSSFQDCENCPQMLDLDLFNAVSKTLSNHNSRPTVSIPALNRISGNPFNEDDLWNNGYKQNATETEAFMYDSSSPQEILPQYSMSLKITHRQYQACVDEGACSPLSDEESLSSARKINIESFEKLSLENKNFEESHSSQPIHTLNPMETSLLDSKQIGNLYEDNLYEWVSHKEDLPIAPISLHSAMEYAQWLSEMTGKPYGILADHEWVSEIEDFASMEDMTPAAHLKNLKASPIFTQDGVLYFIHSQETNTSAEYSRGLEQALENTFSFDDSLTLPIDERDESSLKLGLPILEESISPDHSLGHAIFRSGFHVARPY